MPFPGGRNGADEPRYGKEGFWSELKTAILSFGAIIRLIFLPQHIPPEWAIVVLVGYVLLTLLMNL